MQLMRMDMSQVSQVKQTMEAYKEIGGGADTSPGVQRLPKGQVWQSEARRLQETATAQREDTDMKDDDGKDEENE